MVVAKVYKYVKHFEGAPKPSNVKIVEEELPPLKDGEFLAEAAYLSVDPYMRNFMEGCELGSTMVGQQVALITESKNPKFPVGKYVVGTYGWRTHTVSTGLEPGNDLIQGTPYILPDISNLSPSLGVGILGMPGNTAYFGFLEICKPKAGETVVVSGAAGAVGSVVGQIAKIKGCKVIGIAGSDEKGKWLVKDLGFDHFINYKTQDVDKKLTELAPQNVDAYFDNVGGEISDTVLRHMNSFGRVSVCGGISVYNDKNKFSGYNSMTILIKQLKVEGFLVFRWLDVWLDGIRQMTKWITEGKIKYQEKVTEGFENMMDAFIDMMKGGNTGKSVVKIIKK